MDKKIKLGISSCLLGENVRYDGGHKLDHYLKDTVSRFVDWISVCPEVECGLGVPREVMYLDTMQEPPRLITKNSRIDHTDKMIKWARGRLKQLEKEELCGFVFKSDSPSCGLNNVFSKKGIGMFAKEFISHFRLIPVEDNDSLRNDKTREAFIEKARAFGKAYNACKIHEK